MLKTLKLSVVQYRVFLNTPITVSMIVPKLGKVVFTFDKLFIAVLFSLCMLCFAVRQVKFYFNQMPQKTLVLIKLSLAVFFNLSDRYSD